LQKKAKSITPENAVIAAELREIQQALEEERAAAGGTTILALFKSSPQRFRRRTLLGIGGQFMQQLSGINLITYVSSYFPYLCIQSDIDSTHLSFSKFQLASRIAQLCCSLDSTE
jgi:hypothetical protein